MSMSLRKWLLGSTIVATATVIAAPAFAQQNAGTPTPTPPAPTTTGGPSGPAAVNADASAQDNTGNEAIVVTGTLFRRFNRETASPITVLSSDDLAKRGITTISDAISGLAANGSGTLPTSFSANGAFANGAAGASLRGLTTDSTLVLFDGLRAAYYPLADDGERNFVDLNTLPESIVDHVDVVKDGASSTYGADAVAGVINVFVKKNIVGFEGSLQGGISQHKDAGEQRATATYGVGDLTTSGYNFYVNFEYQHDDLLRNSDRGFPYNTGDLSSLNGDVSPGYDGNAGATSVGTYGTTVPVVRPVTVGPDGAVTPVPGGLLTPLSGSCGSQITHTNATGTFCEQNLVKDYYVLQPQQTRLGGTAHLTANIGSNAQAYAMFTYYQDRVSYPTLPTRLRHASNTGDVTGANVVLPAVLSNGQINPQDPYAALGEAAQIYYRFADLDQSNSSLNRVFRGAAGINGSFGADESWHYDVAGVGMADNLTSTFKGYPIYSRVFQAAADGSYNFVDPSANTAAERAFIAPTDVSQSHSQEYEGNASISHAFFHLPGGDLQVAVGGSVRYESVNDPSANPDNAADPADQYYTINGFGAIGHRTVYSGYFEVDAPIVKALTATVSGRYDHYSEGFSNFSPKVGVKFTPITQLALRGTFSKGFRVPSFAETGALPTIGFITINPETIPEAASFVAAHGDDNYAKAYSLGLNSVGNPNLKPEKATNFTGGFVAQPTHWLTITGDYYHIKKKDFITLADYSGPVAQYFSGQPISGGLSITPDIGDPDCGVAANPAACSASLRPGIVNLGYINAASLLTDGFDGQVQVSLHLSPTVKFSSTFDGTYIRRYNVTSGAGTQKYAGTLGPINVTSGSGTPRFRANWQNTLDVGKVSLTATAYYTSGYKATAEDVSGAGTRDDCSQSQVGFGGSPIRCHIGSFVDVDLTAMLKVTDGFTFFTNVINVANTKPPLDTGTYGGYLYNPAWAEQGIVGRYFKVGANFKF